MTLQFELCIYSGELKAGQKGFDSKQGQKIFGFSTTFRLTLVSTQPPMQWVRRVRSQGVKRPVHEAGHSHSTSFEAKNSGVISLVSCTSS
jgi:hypothetical protein